MVTLRKLYLPLLALVLVFGMVLPAQAANVYVDMGGAEVQLSEATAAKRTLVYPVTTAEVSTTEVFSKAGGTLDQVSAGAQAVILDLICKFEMPAADVDTLGPICYKLTGATDVVYLYGIQVVAHDPYADIAVAPADYLTAAGVATDVGAEYADAVLDEALAGHAGVGTLGKAVADTESDATDILADTGSAGVVVASLAADSVSASALKTDAAEEISDMVWDELLSAHTGAGSFGKSMADTEADATLIVADTGTDGVVVDAGSLATDAAEEIADTVWDELLAGHVGALGFGKAVADIEADATLILADTGTDGVVVDAGSLATDAAEEIADTVWDEALSGHTNAGSFGKSGADIESDVTLVLADTGTDGVVVASLGASVITAASMHATAGEEIADTVWDEATSAHTNAGSTSQAVIDILDDTGTSGCVIGAFGADSITAAVIQDAAFDAATFDTDSITADALKADAATEIAAAVNAENVGVYQFLVQEGEVTALRRTLYFRALGTLPANAQISINGGNFAATDNAPATIQSTNWRELELSVAEVADNGRIVVNVTTTSTVSYTTLIIDVVDFDPFTEGARRPRGGWASGR